MMSKSETVQSYETLFCFHQNGKAFRIDFKISGIPVMTQLPGLRRKGEARSFAATLYRNQQVFITGGLYKEFRSVFAYDIHEQIWSEGPMLNHQRFAHSSCTQGTRAYVFGGMNNQGSIESIDVE